MKLDKVTRCCSTKRNVEVLSLLQRMSNTRPKAITLDVEMEDYYRKKGTGRMIESKTIIDMEKTGNNLRKYAYENGNSNQFIKRMQAYYLLLVA